MAATSPGSPRLDAPQAKPVDRHSARTEMPEALRRDVRAFGDLLGEVITEFGGPGLLADVRRLRELAIAAHHDAVEAEAAAQAAEDLVASWPLDRAEEVAHAFTVYFHLVNIAEEYHRVRSLRAADEPGRPVPDTVAAAVREVAARQGPARAKGMLAGLEFHPVLTAHPTEARRRAVVTSIRRISDLLGHRDDERLGESERVEIRRRLREEIDLMWRTAALRERRPTPLDEVRTAMAVFDEVLFLVVPQIYRRSDNQLAGDEAGTLPPQVPAFVRFGSWIGGDRDGNPYVTAAVTRQALGIQSDHVLRALENAAVRVGRALTVSALAAPPSAGVRRLIAESRADAPDLVDELDLRAPGEPHRVALLLVAERIAATRRRSADLAYERAIDLLEDLRVLQRSLAASGAARQAYGELQNLCWQVETFGFHLAELEVRQHSAVHARALGEIHATPAGAGSAALSEEAEEVLATLRVIAQIQHRYGTDACRRYVVSFTQGADDVAAVYELAEAASSGKPLVLDVVPLFETGKDLARCTEILDEVIALPQVRRRLSETGRRYEVMLGYSDSAKDIGPVSATLALYQAQDRLAAWAARHAIALTMFHGRGGALGRGGGPANRAVLAQAPGSVAGRFKLTEQGEVIFARYGSMPIARRHVEQVANAVLLASTEAVQERTTAAAAAYADIADLLDRAAREAYHRLVRSEGFAEWFATVTPMEELGALALGSRPARRGLSASGLEDLRAIPWVFSWAQARTNVPGWYGLGTGLLGVADRDRLQQAFREWPLFTVMLENAEMSLAKTDRRIMARYLDIGGRHDLTEQIMEEHARTIEQVLTVTGHRRLLEDRRVLGRAVALRNPYIDALSYLQVRALRALRAPGRRSDDETAQLRRLLHLTVNGVAAGLQNTG